MKKQIKDIIIFGLGWFFVILGIAGVFLPILQGVLFLLIGLFLLSRKSRWARKLLNKLKYRYPRIYGQAVEARVKAERYLGKILRKS